ncbi:hypothetical protein Q4610_10015 [Sphingobium sp. HBC34]|uniref:Uncharacterized protein n=1 Tax=Sphingobium cyanobacteriorum TaxID=3063954 RepID=A0ABT8ZLN8_9SPHN|nr:hypothetical protein [Sphingobium sp. HBC34]MDO7835381.1 hypothetical protein [Sphingobium sp. HBC34]
MLRIKFCVAAFLVLCGAASAQTVSGPIVATTAPAATAVPAGTYVDFEILDPLNSKLSKPGDRFRIRTTVPVGANGATVVPAGALGEGEVIHAARARAAGKAGELILAARFIEHQGQRIALRSFRFAQAGESRTDQAIIVGMVAVPVVLFMAGSDVDVPAGARGQAKLVADIPFVLPSNGN